MRPVSHAAAARAPASSSLVVFLPLLRLLVLLVLLVLPLPRLRPVARLGAGLHAHPPAAVALHPRTGTRAGRPSCRRRYCCGAAAQAGSHATVLSAEPPAAAGAGAAVRAGRTPALLLLPLGPLGQAIVPLPLLHLLLMLLLLQLPGPLLQQRGQAGEVVSGSCVSMAPPRTSYLG